MGLMNVRELGNEMQADNMDENWSASCCEFSTTNLTVLFISAISLVVIITVCLIHKFKNKVKTVTQNMIGSSRPRFRKRDKMIFYGRKMIRKVKSLSYQDGGKGRKRQIVIRLAKRLLRLKKEQQPLTLLVKEPSQSFLEEDIGEQSESRLPREVMYMLNSVRIFGFYEKPLFLELCKMLQTMQIPSGQMLFSIGDPDDSIYVVQSGRLTVFVTESDGRELHLKKVNEGESIASLLSIMDVLTGHPAQYKTVSAKALEDCSVLRLPVEAFKVLLKQNPESLVRLTQAVMVRLQRVTFTALHHCLGLTTQLIKTHSKKPFHSLSPKASPSRPQSRRISQENSQSAGKIGNDVFNFEKTVTFADKPYELQSTDDEKFRHSDNYMTEADAASLRGYVSAYFEKAKQIPSGITTGTSDAVKIRRRKTSFYFPEEKVLKAEEDELKRMAIDGFMAQLGIEDETMVKEYVIVKEHPPNICLTQEDSLHADLFLVLSGSLVVSQKSANKMEDNILFIAHSGDIVGALAVTTGDPSLFTIKTRHTSRIGIIPKDYVYEILHQTPVSILNFAHIVIRRLSPFVRQIDFALDWINIESGKALYRQDDDSDCMYILLSGRLRSVLTRKDGKKELVGEYGKGDLVGVVEVLTESKRSTTVMAVRDSELAKLPEELLLTIKTKYPEIVQRLIHLLGDSILGSLQKGMTVTSERMLNLDSRPSGSNFATVAIMAVNEEVPLSAFTMELYHSLTTIGETLRLTSDFIRKTSGPSSFNSANEYRLCAWLAQQEDQHRIVLYQCDLEFTPWTQRCIRQADCILIVALANQEPTVGELEKQLEHMSIKTQKELILLHRDDGLKPRNTVQWLNMRSWCSSHHHIRCPKRMFAKKSHTKMMELYKKIFKTEPNIHSDFSRLSRFLTGTTYGLVLGGGGARGAAHVGMIKAILEAGIPIDMVGGVSIGAFIGALWCAEKDITTVTQKAREWALKKTSYWSQLLDCTFPTTSYLTGTVFNRGIKEVFGERQIEDLWLPYFTVTTDITSSTMRIHTHGSLWRYVRASMSLSGFVPPLCDPLDGHLLLDGGYVNNVPADIMKEKGAQMIIAIDVGSQEETDLTNYGDTLSGWWLLWKRLNRWTTPIKVPNFQEIQSRLTYVCCSRQLEQVKQSDYCTYLRPPIDKYATLQFKSFDEIMEVGYNYGKNYFNENKGKHHGPLCNYQSSNKHEFSFQSGKNLCGASFIDLTERVCKIQPPRPSQLSDFSEEEEYEYEREAASEPEPDLLLDTDREDELSPSNSQQIGSLSDVE